jgi:hypothetical protein
MIILGVLIVECEGDTFEYVTCVCGTRARLVG